MQQNLVLAFHFTWLARLYSFDSFEYFALQDSAKLAEKLESCCKKCDRQNRGALTPDEFFTVIKVQNGIDVGKEEVGRSCSTISIRFLIRVVESTSYRVE